MKVFIALLCASVLAGPAGIARAGPDEAGDADPAAAGFLAALQAAGIAYNGTERVIATAEAVCDLVGSGRSGPEVLAALRSRNPSLTPEHGSQFLAIALRSYCPDRLGPPGPAPAEPR